MRTLSLSACLACVSFLPSAAVAQDPAASPGIPERLRLRLEQPPVTLAVGDEPIYTTEALPRFYEERGYRPAWILDGRPGNGAHALLASILTAADEGLRPEDYHRRAIQARLEDLPGARPLSEGEQVDLDLLLTDAFLLEAAHLVSGRLDPETFHPEWVAVRREVDLVPVLEGALSNGDIASALASLLPVHPDYARLRAALTRYRAVAASGGWPALAEGSALRRGDTGDRVATLRRRLAASGDLDTGPGGDFDATVEEAVRRFQRRHGLDADGVAGRLTVAVMNVPAERRIRQIELNMERWRWLPRDLGRRHIIVNIPGFRLDGVEEDRTTLTMPVIVGQAYRRTPVFSDAVTYMVLNPYWEVPFTLAVQDKLPLIRKDASYLQKEGFKVLQGWGAAQQEIDPAAVDWASLGARSFPYRLRQDPGPRNALGRIKFMFPNKFNVYLHDTPARELFAKSDRDFSSGCIRVGDPVALARFLLAGAPDGAADRVESLLVRGETRTLSVVPPVPVHLLYWTAWADDVGAIHFRRDLYGRDADLDTALSLPPPVS